jgi:hypothetical protein
MPVFERWSPTLATVQTGRGPVQVVIAGALGGRLVVRWQAGPRAGALGWVEAAAVTLTVPPVPARRSPATVSLRTG